MKLNFKKLTILGLVTAVFFYGVFCCCFNNIAEAEEPVPSCHQTTHDTESSQNTEECECDEALAVIEKESHKINPLEVGSLLGIDCQIGSEIYLPIVKIANHDPPVIYDTTPLYIKHSILRI